MNTASNYIPKNKELKEIVVTLHYFWIAYHYGMYICLRVSYRPWWSPSESLSSKRQNCAVVNTDYLSEHMLLPQYSFVSLTYIHCFEANHTSRRKENICPCVVFYSYLHFPNTATVPWSNGIEYGGTVQKEYNII